MARGVAGRVGTGTPMARARQRADLRDYRRHEQHDRRDRRRGPHLALCRHELSAPYGGTFGRYAYVDRYLLLDDGAPQRRSPDNPNGVSGTATCPWRWADADACGSGVSGPTLDGSSAYGPYTGKVINQNAYPDRWSRNSGRGRANPAVDEQ